MTRDIIVAQVRKNTQIAGLYFLQCETYHIGPRPSPLDTADYPENMLFKYALPTFPLVFKLSYTEDAAEVGNTL